MKKAWKKSPVIPVALKLKYVNIKYMSECEKENIYLIFTTLFTGFMWLLSEIIGSSKCSAGGVFEFVINGYCVEISRDTRNTSRERVRVTVVEPSQTPPPGETSLLIEA